MEQEQRVVAATAARPSAQSGGGRALAPRSGRAGASSARTRAAAARSRALRRRRRAGRRRAIPSTPSSASRSRHPRRPLVRLRHDVQAQRKLGVDDAAASEIAAGSLGRGGSAPSSRPPRPQAERPRSCVDSHASAVSPTPRRASRRPAAGRRPLDRRRRHANAPRALSSSAAASDQRLHRSTRSRYAPTKWISLGVRLGQPRANRVDSANRADSHTCLNVRGPSGAEERTADGATARAHRTHAPRAPPGRRRAPATRTAARALSAARLRRSSGRRGAPRRPESEPPPSMFVCSAWSCTPGKARARHGTSDIGRVGGVGVAASASASLWRRRRRRRWRRRRRRVAASRLRAAVK